MSQEQNTEKLTEQERKKLEKRMDVINIELGKLSDEDFNNIHKNDGEIKKRNARISELEPQLPIEIAKLTAMKKRLEALEGEERRIFEEQIQVQQKSVNELQGEINKLKTLNSQEPSILIKELNQIYEMLNPPNINQLKIIPLKSSKQEPKKLIQDLRKPEILTGIQESLSKDDYFIKQALRTENDNKWTFSSKDNKEEFELTNNYARTSHCSEKNLTTMVNVLAKGLDENIKSLQVSGNTPETREKTEKLLAKALLENNKKDVVVNGKSITDILSPKPTQQSNPPKPPPLPPLQSSGPRIH